MDMATDATDNFEESLEHWLIRARYHVRMENYWRDRALSAEKKLEQLLLESSSKKKEK